MNKYAFDELTIFNSLENEYYNEVAILMNISEFAEAVVQRCSAKKVFLEISQNSQENTCARVSFLIKLQASGFPVFVFLRILWNF